VCVYRYVYEVYDKEKFGGGVKGFCGKYKNPFSQYIGHSRKQRTEYGRSTPYISLVYIYYSLQRSTAHAFHPSPLYHSPLASTPSVYTRRIPLTTTTNISLEHLGIH